MYVTMNRCGNLYTKILYSKHTEYKLVVTHSHSLTYHF